MEVQRSHLWSHSNQLCTQDQHVKGLPVSMSGCDQGQTTLLLAYIITRSCSLWLRHLLCLYWNVTAFLLQDNLRQNHFTSKYKPWESNDDLKLDKESTVPSTYSPFLGLASSLFLDPAIYPFPIHTSPDTCLSSGPASTLPETLLDILLKSLPPTRPQALTMPLPWHLLHCSYKATSALPSGPRETPGSLTVPSVGPSGPLLTAPVSLLQGISSSQPSSAFFREPSSPSTVETRSASTLLLLIPELKRVSTTATVCLWLVFSSSPCKAFGILYALKGGVAQWAEVSPSE